MNEVNLKISQDFQILLRELIYQSIQNQYE